MPSAEGQDLIGHVQLAELNVNVGMPLAKGPNDHGKDREVDPRGEAHDETIHLATLRPLHGGTVEAQSDGRDRGATFIVTLPMVAG